MGRARCGQARGRDTNKHDRGLNAEAARRQKGPVDGERLADACLSAFGMIVFDHMIRIPQSWLTLGFKTVALARGRRWSGCGNPQAPIQ